MPTLIVEYGGIEERVDVEGDLGITEEGWNLVDKETKGELVLNYILKNMNWGYRVLRNDELPNM